MQHTEPSIESSPAGSGIRRRMPPWAICWAGAMGLATAMGIGRFAFTPLLPLMQREGLLDVASGAWLAWANYLGYLAGALTAARLPGQPRTQLLLSLAATAVVTCAMAAGAGVVGSMVWRFAAGVVSAWTLVTVSGWAGAALMHAGRPGATGWVFSGVGVGIALAGAWAWWRSADGVQALWLQLGAVALFMAAGVGWLTRGGGMAHPPVTQPSGAVVSEAQVQVQALRKGRPLVASYATLGLGYILPATYLPALARGLLDDPDRFGLVWPVFGAAAALSTLLAGRALRRWPARRIWAVSHGLMAWGCMLPAWSQTGWSVAASALLVGGTFMVATMTGLQEARSLMPAAPRPLLARMTAAFACGQMAGPLLVLVLGVPAALPGGLPPISLGLWLAAGGLLVSAGWLARTSAVENVN